MGGENSLTPMPIGCKTGWESDPVGLIAIPSQNILYWVHFGCMMGHSRVQFET
jgi:hypothetical protein